MFSFIWPLTNWPKKYKDSIRYVWKFVLFLVRLPCSQIFRMTIHLTKVPFMYYVSIYLGLFNPRPTILCEHIFTPESKQKIQLSELPLQVLTYYMNGPQVVGPHKKAHLLIMRGLFTSYTMPLWWENFFLHAIKFGLLKTVFPLEIWLQTSVFMH